ncbi:MAG: cupin domain-containing protein [Lachnospiraceae bacterium]|nr:cupin domain-containing protein [Lachnospiraceae bacterium]
MQKYENDVFSLVDENVPVPGCTISGEILPGITCFSLAEGTSISAESYPVSVVQYVLSGETLLKEHDKSNVIPVRSGETIIKEAGRDIGIKAEKDTVYVEIPMKGDSGTMNGLNAGEVFKFTDLVPYQDGKIISRNVVDEEKTKLALMSFDAGTGLQEHAAPGEAIIFALDGEGIIGYEGQEHVIHAGENFHFAKGGKHYVKAEGHFKMVLLLVLD